MVSKAWLRNWYVPSVELKLPVAEEKANVKRLIFISVANLFTIRIKKLSVWNNEKTIN